MPIDQNSNNSTDINQFEDNSEGVYGATLPVIMVLVAL